MGGNGHSIQDLLTKRMDYFVVVAGWSFLLHLKAQWVEGRIPHSSGTVNIPHFVSFTWSIIETSVHTTCVCRGWICILTQDRCKEGVYCGCWPPRAIQKRENSIRSVQTPTHIEAWSVQPLSAGDSPQQSIELEAPLWSDCCFVNSCRLSSPSSPWGPLSLLRWYLVGFDIDSKSPIHKLRWMKDRNPGWCSEVESGLELLSSAPNTCLSVHLTYAGMWCFLQTTFHNQLQWSLYTIFSRFWPRIYLKSLRLSSSHL